MLHPKGICYWFFFWATYVSAIAVDPSVIESVLDAYEAQSMKQMEISIPGVPQESVEQMLEFLPEEAIVELILNAGYGKEQFSITNVVAKVLMESGLSQYEAMYSATIMINGLYMIREYTVQALRDSDYFCKNSQCVKDDSHNNNLNWMGRISGDTPLSMLSIPGTHDSGAVVAGPGGFLYEGLVVCQVMSFEEQLRQGVRAFDIRVRHIGNVYAIHHGVVFQEMFFGEVASIMANFLDNNPEETIIIRHKEEFQELYTTRTYEETMDWYVRNHPRLEKVGSEDEAVGYTLDDARGKILIDYYDLMQKSIQDDYDIDSCEKNQGKTNSIMSQIISAQNTPDNGILHINFVSGTGGVKAYNPDALCSLFIDGIAQVQNNILGNMLSTISDDSDHVTRRIGIIFSDFSGQELTSLVIEQNFL